MKWIQERSLYFAWLVSLVGFCLSVLYGEILKNPPCPLCWYQRIALFPLVILLGIAAYRGEKFVVPYVLPIVFVGGALALFQVLRDVFPSLARVQVCNIGVSCSNVGFTFFGFSGFPLLSMLGFFFIAAFLLLSLRAR